MSTTDPAVTRLGFQGLDDRDLVERMVSSAVAQLGAPPTGPIALPPELRAAGVMKAPDAAGFPFAEHVRALSGELSEDALLELARPLLGPVPVVPPVPSGPAIAPPSPAPSAAGISAGPSFDVDAVRRDFPILNERVHGHPLIWLDNAATTQKPRAVIERLVTYYERENSNVHRGAHTLAARATEAFEKAREAVRRFLNAGSVNEIVFTRGTTEAINLVAQTWGRGFVGRGDEILLTTLEHHSNIVPWQLLARDAGARLRVAPITDRGEVPLDAFERLLTPRTRLVAFSHVSNALGTVLPVRTMVDMAHQHGALALVDGAQAVLHFPVDVSSLDCDFYAFSGHKLLAPTGIGALYGKGDLLRSMPPWQGGGNMIDRVTFESTTYAGFPARFEAGTGSIGDAAALGAAIEYLEGIGLARAATYERGLMAYATRALSRIEGLRPIGTAEEKAGVLSFVVDWMRPEDMGRYLDTQGIAVRAGHHCAQPALRHFGLASTVRPSLAFYNTREEVDALLEAIQRSRVS